MKKKSTIVPWIDENINPYTGDWISRTILKQWGNGTWSFKKGGKERGKDYNHSTFVDLVISGLIGIIPRSKDFIEINPLIPDGEFAYFCLDNVKYHNRIITIIWDVDGSRYSKGKGFKVYIDRVLVKKSLILERFTIGLSSHLKNKLIII